MKSLLNLALMAALVMGAASCGKTEQQPAQSAESTDKAVNEMVIRYVDEDSLFANYNLAKDVKDAILRCQSQLDQAQQQRGTEIQKFASEVERKYKNNGYLTEESFNVDQQKLNKMQVDAQNYLGKLQQTLQVEMEGMQKQLNDSIDSYIENYAKTNGIDMVLRKSSQFSATVYVGEKFDITGDIVNGLNKRYTKVEKK